MKKTIVKIVLWVFGIIVAILIIGTSILEYSMYSSAKAITTEAKSEFKSDSIQSLINYINSPNHTLKEKNSAVWALGQFADKKAVPFLTKLSEELTGSDGEELSHNKYICRYEVDKALRWCKEGNILKFMYSNRDKW